MARNPVVYVGSAVLVLVGIVVGALLTMTHPPKPKQWPPVSRAEAEALFLQTARLAEAGEYDTICQYIAEIQEECQSFVKDTVVYSHWVPGTELPQIVGGAYRDGQDPRFMLRIKGVRLDGTTYYADFDAERRSSDGRVVSRIPVFWSGVTQG